MATMKDTELKVFSGNSNKPLARNICKHLGIPLGKSMVKTFANGESQVEIHENVRGRDVFLIQTGSKSVNHHLMEMLVMIDALKRACAGRINVVMPLHPYSRQDRKVKPRVPITAKLVAGLIEKAGGNRMITLDLHAGQEQGFYDTPADNLFSVDINIPYLQKEFEGKKLVVLSPDMGGIERANAYAKRLNAGLAIASKRRPKPGEIDEKAIKIIGNVRGKKVLIVDDMIDTAKTMITIMNVLMKKGATEINACATHAVFSSGAIERIEKSCLKKLIVTDTLKLGRKASKCKKIVQLSSAKLFADAIKNTHEDESVSELFTR
jgi:ribose-phosphate pyrophosphokinase